MKERPILFSGPMVRALLDGRKTQTRRAIRPDWWRCLDPEDEDDRAQALTMCPYGTPGDRLWVRETWLSNADLNAIYHQADFQPRYGAWEWDDTPGHTVRVERWRPSIHMPRWASRITLELTAVRVERLQDISEADARAEGVEWMDPPGGLNVTGWRGHRFSFGHLWDSLNAKRAPWASNPWVWVLEFKRVDSDTEPRQPGCQCHLEVGDSPCRVHGEDSG